MLSVYPRFIAKYWHLLFIENIAFLFVLNFPFVRFCFELFAGGIILRPLLRAHRTRCEAIISVGILVRRVHNFTVGEKEKDSNVWAFV